MEIIKYPIRLGQDTSEGDTMTGKTRQQQIFALVAKWQNNDRIPVSFDDWWPQVMEGDDLEGWVNFNIKDYLEHCLTETWGGTDVFDDEEKKVIRSILKETEKIMSMEEPSLAGTIIELRELNDEGDALEWRGDMFNIIQEICAESYHDHMFKQLYDVVCFARYSQGAITISFEWLLEQMNAMSSPALVYEGEVVQ